MVEAIGNILKTIVKRWEREKHLPECNKAFESYEKEVAEYKKKWPNYCRSCGGWSGGFSNYDPSPAGVSLGSGYMTDFDPCPDCYEKGICARCGKQMFNPEEGDDPESCPHCGFDFGVNDNGLR
jgi:hypothetical protein